MTSGVMRRKGGELSESVTGHSFYCCAPFVYSSGGKRKNYTLSLGPTVRLC